MESEDPIPINELDLDGSLLTKNQIEIVSKLKESVKQTFNNYNYLKNLDILRFAIARKFDFDKSWDMLKKHIQWRIDNNIDQFTFPFNIVPIRKYKCYPDNNGEKSEEGFRKLSTVFGWSQHSFSLAGQPLSISHAGHADAVTVAQIFKQDELLLMMAKYLEFVTKVLIPEGISRTGNKKIVGIAFIFDLNGLSLRQFHTPALNILKGVLDFVNNNYPERLGHIFAINAPSIFKMFWKLISGWLDPRTIARFHILDSNYKSELLKYFDPSDLPDFVGGTCHCTYYGGCVPWCTSPGYENPNYRDDALIANISPGSVFCHEVEITSVGQVINCWFSANGQEINFKVMKVDTAEEVFPLKNFEGEKWVHVPITPSSTGTFTLIWQSEKRKIKDLKLQISVDSDPFSEQPENITIRTIQEEDEYLQSSQSNNNSNQTELSNFGEIQIAPQIWSKRWFTLLNGVLRIYNKKKSSDFMEIKLQNCILSFSPKLKSWTLQRKENKPIYEEYSMEGTRLTFPTQRKNRYICTFKVLSNHNEWDTTLKQQVSSSQPYRANIYKIFDTFVNENLSKTIQESSNQIVEKNKELQKALFGLEKKCELLLKRVDSLEKSNYSLFQICLFLLILILCLKFIPP